MGFDELMAQHKATKEQAKVAAWRAERARKDAGLNPARRGLNQDRFNELKRLITAQQMGIQTGFNNQSQRSLLQSGLGRSGRRFAAPAAAASAASKFGADANRQLAALDDQTAESNFRFDVGKFFNNEGLEFQYQAQRDRQKAKKFNPLKAAIDIGTGIASVV